MRHICTHGKHQAEFFVIHGITGYRCNPAINYPVLGERKSIYFYFGLLVLFYETYVFIFN